MMVKLFYGQAKKKIQIRLIDMKKKDSIFLFLIVFALSSCSTQTVNDEGENQQTSSTIVADNEWDELIKKIDEECPELTRIESLLYYKEDMSSMFAVAYLDQNKLITKIEQESVDGVTGYKTLLSFYSKDGIRFASQFSTVKGSGENAYFSQERTFYSPQGLPTLTKERKSTYEIHIDNEPFYASDTVRHSDQNAFLILKQQGPYATTFQGFVESGAFHFLVVGENTTNGYSASLSIQEDSPTLNYLRKAGEKALGLPLHVDFEHYKAPTGYTMQLLRSVSVVKEEKELQGENKPEKKE